MKNNDSRNNTKEKIIQAMYKSVALRGYSKSSIAMICNDIGITKPAVYYYFTSKEEIFMAMVKQMFSHNEYDGYSFDNNADNFKKQFIEFGDTIINGFKSDEEQQKVMTEINTEKIRQPRLKAFMEDHKQNRKQQMLNIVEKGVDIGVFHEGYDKKALATIVDMILLGIADELLVSKDTDGHRIWREFVEIITR